MTKIINEEEAGRLCNEINKIFIKNEVTVGEAVFVLQTLERYLQTHGNKTIINKKVNPGEVKYV